MSGTKSWGVWALAGLAVAGSACNASLGSTSGPVVPPTDAAVVSPADAAACDVPNDCSCKPGNVTQAPEWNAMFDRKDGVGWSGGDAAYTVPLPGHRVLWYFGDSYLGGFASGKRTGVEFRLGNTIAVQENAAPDRSPSPADFRFDWGPGTSNGWLPIPNALLEDPAAPASAAMAAARSFPIVAWPLHGIAIGSDLVLFNVPVTASQCMTCAFPWKLHGTTITVIRGVDRPYDQWGVLPGPGGGWDAAHTPQPEFVPHSRSAASLDDTTSLLWGTFVMRDPGAATTVYVYGHRDVKGVTSLAVARVQRVQRADDLLDFARWTFWDGKGWGSDPDLAAAIAHDSEPEASVVPIPASMGCGFALVQSGDLYAGETRVSLAPAPWGPFVGRYQLSLGDCPVPGFDPKGKQLTYAAKVHPELSSDDALLLSLVNQVLPSPLINTDPDQYVPRFLHVPWSEIVSQAHSSPQRCGAPAVADAAPAP